VRTSPVSMHSSAIALSGNVNGIVVRVTSVVKRGRRPRFSALPSVRRNGVVAKRSGSDWSRHRPLNSARAFMPPALFASAGPLTVAPIADRPGARATRCQPRRARRRRCRVRGERLARRAALQRLERRMPRQHARGFGLDPKLEFGFGRNGTVRAGAGARSARAAHVRP
jgi:hypothetical protein